MRSHALVRVALVAALALPVFAFAGCADDGEADEDDPVSSLDALKADSMRSPTEMGPIGSDHYNLGTLKAGERYQLWTFSLRQHWDQVELQTSKHARADRDVNTVIYLFHKQADGTWGHYLARNDDGVWQFSDGSSTDTEDLAPWSYLHVSLDKGDYALLVKGKYRTTKGDYQVTYTCIDGNNDVTRCK